MEEIGNYQSTTTRFDEEKVFLKWTGFEWQESNWFLDLRREIFLEFRKWDEEDIELKCIVQLLLACWIVTVSNAIEIVLMNQAEVSVELVTFSKVYDL